MIFGHFWNCKKWIFVKIFFHEIDLFDFTSFLAWTFLIFWPTATVMSYNILLLIFTHFKNTIFADLIPMLEGNYLKFLVAKTESHQFLAMPNLMPGPLMLRHRPHPHHLHQTKAQINLWKQTLIIMMYHEEVVEEMIL